MKPSNFLAETTAFDPTTCLMPSGLHNSKGMDSIFDCLTSLQPKRCILACRSMYNTFFILTSVLLCVPFNFADNEKHQFDDSIWWLPLCNRNRLCFFIVTTLITDVLSSSSWFFTAVYYRYFTLRWLINDITGVYTTWFLF